MTCFFSVIVWFAGEVGAMAFGRVASTVYILVGVGGSLGKQRGFGGDEILQHQLIGPVVYTSHDFVGGYPMIFRVSTMIYRVITPVNMV
jgi:hypothetical protein